MTADNLLPAAPAAAFAAADPDTSLTRIESGYRTVLRVQQAVTWIPIAIAAIVLDAIFLDGTPLRWLPSVLALGLGAVFILVIPARRYRRIGYALTDHTIRIVRGYLFHIDTVVPFVRVQHIDVARGPIERVFGVASLVVHTAGTHNSIVTLPGLAPATAAALRDTIRGHIRSDYA
ncbi:PH domain-containing protein [Sphingorhabdus soli]|uniref:PH domain-containing protein n=1 Tax=Flavisphingopyxis soli TaxID=2601267 RepID=A0A5C6U7Q3_9SPHN|nr:PH domain-containing protein [Sphingorhabdus soli]TXC68121.1 PH domain-containing protein [Sphingorhabdus soli]